MRRDCLLNLHPVQGLVRDANRMIDFAQISLTNLPYTAYNKIQPDQQRMRRKILLYTEIQIDARYPAPLKSDLVSLSLVPA